MNEKRNSKSVNKWKVLWVLIVITAILVAGIYYFNTKPERDITKLSFMVAELFESDEETSLLSENNEIKPTTNQAQIDKVVSEINKIDLSSKRYEKYNFVVLSLLLALDNAQEQLNEKLGKDTSKQDSMNASEEDEFEDEETYQVEETDIVFRNDVLENEEILESFMEVAGTDNESKIRIVKYVNGQGTIIYDIESRYDSNQDVGWIEVKPDLSYYTPKKDEGIDVFNNTPQQCGSIEKDLERGYYKYFECYTHWEYFLFPIPEMASRD